MEIINILECEDLKKHIENLKKICTWIEQNDNHRNAKNYYNLDQIVDKFDSFEIIYDDQKVVAFSGLWNNGHFAKNSVRCCTRTYYMPDYRNNNLTHWGDSTRKERWSEDWFIPFEVNKAKELGYEYAFISIELLVRRRSMQSLIKYLNKQRPWVMHEQMCNTCRQHNDKGTYIGVNQDNTCWQNVCYTKLVDNENTLDLPSISIEEYNNKYAVKQKDRLKLT